jgi:serine/threonine protein phosphatase 1
MKGNYVKKTKTGRRFAIGDIHGCYETFYHLVTNILKLQKEDQLFLLGDYVHRGPSQFKVIDFILELQSQNFEVYPLRGNHEQMMMEKYGDSLVSPYREFLFNLPYYYETTDFYFVHAALNFRAEDPLEEYYSMLWSREHSEADEEFLGNRRVVFGHTIHKLSTIQKAAINRDRLIPLDNGCYTGLDDDEPETGNLCALDLDQFVIHAERNRENI